MPTVKQRFGNWIIPRIPVSRRAFDIVRFELGALRTRLLARVDPRSVIAIKKLSRMKNLRVNLGSGGHAADGWLNVDVQGSGPGRLRWDIRRRLPFPPESASLVCASHVLEHLDFRQEVPRLLADIIRVLEPGGRLRIVVPDAARYLEAYVTGDQDRWASLGVAKLPNDLPTYMALVNHVFHQGGEHQFGYDFDTLEYLLRGAGFKEIARSAFQRSVHFDAALDPAVHAPYSLYIEATRP